jgi:hypothetical protein
MCSRISVLIVFMMFCSLLISRSAARRGRLSANANNNAPDDAENTE